MMPSWTRLLAFGRWRAWQKRRAGNRARDARDWPLAIAEYEAYLATCPQDWPIRVQLGHAYKETGDLSAAERAYREAAAAAPDNADVFLQLGHLLKLTGRWNEAREAYRRSAELDPAGPAAAELPALDGAGTARRSGDTGPGIRDRDSGDAARDARQWLAAAHHYEACLKERPYDSVIWLQFGNVLKEAGRLTDAERAYRRAMELDVPLGNAFLPKTLLDAQAARDERRWADAAALYRTYLMAKADAEQVWYELALALRHSGHYHEAYDAIERAVALAPDTITILREQALLLRYVGKIEASTALFMQIMQRTGSAELLDETGQPIRLF